MKPRYWVEPTHALPQGVEYLEHGIRFSVFAPDATCVELCIFNAQEKLLTTLPLMRTEGDYWAGLVMGLRMGQRYAYRAHGPQDPENGYLFDPDRFLLDPYARSLSHPLIWDTKSYQQKKAKFIPKAMLCNLEFDWQGVTSPQHPLEKTIIYETHVKGMTQRHPNIPKEIRGTYLGLCHPVFIEHLKKLGITAVQLMPIAAFTSETRLQDLGLVNYWGYNPVCFMAPEPRYAQKDAVHEFKTMVRELHRAGIEVILDVVFNHTAEGGHGGPVLSLKGLANRHYYVFEGDEQQTYFEQYTNVTGCGNTVHVSSSQGLQLVMDSLRYWVTEMHVDGFRFDLAVTLAREPQGFNPHGIFFKAIHQDPVLQKTKLIAEPWDIGSYGYRLGQFPRLWLELNDTFRDRTRSFWRGDGDSMADFATRFLGSRDTFPLLFRHPLSSVNYVCYHDGFTLEDLVSYQERHNWDNGEDNRDGHGHNISDNYGVEGPTQDPAILHIRQQQKRNFIATTLFACGVPHFLAGDEFGRTQNGNNNAYCQDNPISWVNWDITENDKKLLEFTQYCIKLRQRMPYFHCIELPKSTCDHASSDPLPQHIFWRHPDGHPLTEKEWAQHHAQAFMLDIAFEGERWLFLFNASTYDIQFHLPQDLCEKVWLQHIDTSINNGLHFIPNDTKNQFAVGRAHSFKLLEYVEKTHEN